MRGFHSPRFAFAATGLAGILVVAWSRAVALPAGSILGLSAVISGAILVATGLLGSARRTGQEAYPAAVLGLCASAWLLVSPVVLGPGPGVGLLLAIPLLTGAVAAILNGYAAWSLSPRPRPRTRTSGQG